MQAVILAGGLGTRMKPITDRIPKSMVPVLGKPFLERQLQLLETNGVRDIVLCIGHMGQMIRDYFGTGEKWGVTIRYSEEGEALLGTAGAVKKAEPVLSDVFFLMYGDSYLLLDYPDIWNHFQKHTALGLMVVYRNENKLEPSNIVPRDGYVHIYDKTGRTPGMKHVNEGLSVLRKSSLALIPSGRPYSQEDFYQELITRHQLLSYETDQRFYEIGSPKGLDELEARLSGQAVTR